MKLIKPSYLILDQKPGLDGIYEQIELAGRTCYKSKRPEGQTAKDFVDRMIKSGHNSMLEHGTVYLKVPNEIVNEGFQFETDWDTLCFNPYTRYSTDCYYYYYTTNYRVIIEHNLQEVLKYLCEPTEFHEKRVTVMFTTSNSIMREFTRHRTMSFAVESTRYCNYSRDRFNNEVTFIRPYWYNEQNPALGEALLTISLKDAEKHYLALIEAGYKPQEAREVLPLATKCDMVMTGFVSDFKHFFDLRAKGTTGLPHPDAKALAEPLMKEFIERKLIEE